MFTDPDTAIPARREVCAVCAGGGLEPVVDLPKLPLTGIYCREPMEMPVAGFDQQLLLCGSCGHAQLARQLVPGVLYDDRYSFRTSASATARKGTTFFLSLLEEMAPERQFNCALDLGCNDLYLLAQLKDRARVRVGIDPLWCGREELREDKSIRVIGSTIEEVETAFLAQARPDLVLCRHTLEHIREPGAVLQRLLDVAAPDALFLFEVPGFDVLVRKLRFDQIFHQHLHYFNLSSFRRLIGGVGGRYLAHREHYQDWGALLVAFTRGNGQKQAHHEIEGAFEASTIRDRYRLFRRHMSAFNDFLLSFEGEKVYGYGAAQMLPVLAYHLGNDLSLLSLVVDDDPGKDGLYYWNLPPPIGRADCVTDWEGASVLITAVDSARAILNKLLLRSPLQILYPLQVM